MFDSHSNFGGSLVVTAPVPPAAGLSLTVTAGTGIRFPTAPFNCTVCPGGVSADFTNAEIIRVTAIVGDTLTIVRAQEGTAAIAVAAGYQVLNVPSVLVFTDIENSIIQAISAAGGAATAATVLFGNSPTVSFGRAGQTITASVGTTAQTAQPVAASASNGSFLFSTLNFTNTSNVTFGTSAGGVIFASVASQTPQTTQPVAASASNGSFLFSTLSFTNANNVTFGTSAGGIIFASVNSNPGQSVQPVAASASNGSFLFSTLNFTNANNVTFGTSAGGVIFASVAAAAGQTTQPVAASASNGSFLFSTLGFSNANNVTFGTSAGSIITASINVSAGGVTGSWFQNQQIGGISFINPGVSTKYGGFFQVPYNLSAGFVRMFATVAPASTNVTSQTTTYNASAECYSTLLAGFYSQGTGVSSNSMIQFGLASAAWTVQNSVSANTAGSQYTITQGFTGVSEGNSSTFTRSYASTSAQYVFLSTGFLTGFNGTRFFDLAFSSSMPPGNYWVLAGYGTSSSASTNGLSNMSLATGAGINVINFAMNTAANFFGGLPQATNTVLGVQAFGFQVSNAAMTLATIFDISTGVTQNGSGANPLFQIIRKA